MAVQRFRASLNCEFCIMCHIHSSLRIKEERVEHHVEHEEEKEEDLRERGPRQHPLPCCAFGVE